MTPPIDSEFPFALLSRIEDASINASAPPQQRWLDGWLVRFSPEKAKRSRCALAVTEGRMPLDKRIAACAGIFTEAKLPMIVRVTPFSVPSRLDARLAELGMQKFDDTSVMARSRLEDVGPVIHAEVQFEELGVEAFARQIGNFQQTPMAQHQTHARRLRDSPVPFTMFQAVIDNEVVACGQYALEGDLVGLYDIFTAPEHRARGLAGALCAHLLRHAHARGARHAYLQVMANNLPAQRAYRRLGFTDGYAYHYRTCDPALA